MRIALLTIWLVVAQALTGICSELYRGFGQPPPSARPWVYWFWMNGNISSNGITADLESLKRAGIGGVLIMEVDYATPKGPVGFGSVEWRHLFQHVCRESARLGLQVRMNNDAGYCGSGGPWISPELSMQRLVWSETVITGSSDLAVPLPQPHVEEAFYRDVAVLAFRTPAEDEIKMADFHPVLTSSPDVPDFDPSRLTDGETNHTIALPQPTPNNPSYIQIEFDRPFTARQFKLSMPLAGDQIVHGFLEASADGREFRPVREIDVIPSTQVFNFPEITARFFRILFRQRNPDVDRFIISELELSSKARLEGIEAKALFTRKNFYPGPSEFPGRAKYSELKPGLPLARNKILDLTSRMAPDGLLRWVPPAGRWTILRLGHTSTGRKNHPAPEGGLGLECDKMSKTATEAAFKGLMAKLADDGKPFIGKSLTSTHIDSWEVGSQNWTSRLPEEFRRRRGYDLPLFLPVITGRVVDSVEISERFLWDLRQTVSELIADNYAGHMRKMAHRHKLDLSIEAYDGPNDDLTYAGRADEPMAEFWSWPAFEMTYTCTEMRSAAHIYGKRIIGAEAFTAMDAEKWLAHPFSIKPFGDWAFCEGINRMVMHRYALQPWTEPTRVPGMAFGPFGIHFERTQTWWEQSKFWNEYLARCQYLLQQGLPVIDICFLAPEMSPRRWRPPGSVQLMDGYSFDGCTAEALLSRMEVRRGNLLLPDGMSYRLLALQETETMTPELLSRVGELARLGATVVGRPPLKSPSLSNYPACDAAVKELTRRIWGDCDGKNVTEHRLGKGKIIWGPTPQQVLMAAKVAPDFVARNASASASFNYIHRRLRETEVYFIANKTLLTEEAICSFRVAAKHPELCWPESGKVEKAVVYRVDEANGTVTMPLRLGPAGSVFVLFPSNPNPGPKQVVSVTREGQSLLSTTLPSFENTPALPDGSNSFTFAFWARPQTGTSLPDEAVFGKGNYFKPRNDALFPIFGHFVYHSPEHAGAGISVGTNGVWVIEHSCDYWGSPLVHAAPLTNWTHIAVVYEDARPRLYLNGKLAREGMRSLMVVHCSVGMQQRRSSAPFVGGLGQMYHEHYALRDPQVAQLMTEMPKPETASSYPAVELNWRNRGLQAEAWQPGRYVAEMASGAKHEFLIPSLPEPVEITGSWNLDFPEGWGAPRTTTLDRLISWSEHTDAGIRHFSGTASYSKKLIVPPNWLGTDRRVYLDLGEIAVIAQVTLNGTNLATLWKPPFRVDISDIAHDGVNQIEIKVVNLWINRMIGDEDLPEDSERNPDGSLKQWPDWLLNGRPSPTGRFTFTSNRLWKKGSPLQSSGLLGPVKLVPSQRVQLISR